MPGLSSFILSHNVIKELAPTSQQLLNGGMYKEFPGYKIMTSDLEVGMEEVFVKVVQKCVSN